MKRILFIISAFLICNSTDGNRQGFYPLQIGNRWYYSDTYVTTDTSTTVAMNDTTMQNGFTYLHLRNKYLFRDEYFRQSGSMVYNYSTDVQAEELWYDFSKTTSDTVAIHYYQYDTSTTVVIYDEMANIFGSVRRVWGFYTTYGSLSAYALEEITDSIGLTYYQIEPGLSNTLHGTILNGKIYGTITGVESQTSLIPKNVQLFQNYPNPFNPSTLINYDLPKSAHVRLTVYDVLGREMAMLVNELQEPGSKSVKFDGTNLPSGMYFYRLDAGNFVSTQKMALIR